LQKIITDDLEALVDILPPQIRQPLHRQKDISELLEVVLDLGRPPEARFPHREMVLNPKEVDEDDIDYVASRVSSFGDDNRAGIERTLHRISAIRNRKGRIIGLTCRVGRAVFGTIKVIEDLVQSGKSVLLLGRPGVGKTTMLREVARVLADDLNKRVIIVDTSNEIAGDGDIPHPAIGHARRMQVKTPTMQHAVMIEAVENHMPEVIVIDEIGTELEAQAARTIAERGVQLVGTAHGNTLENLMMNPTLSDLIGGIQSVTLGDELVATEVRWLDEAGEVRSKKEALATTEKISRVKPQVRGDNIPKLYLFGVNRGRMEQVAKDMQLSPNIVESLNDASLLVTSKSHYRRKPQKVRDAETANLPIYVLKSNTPAQFRQLLNTIYPKADAEKIDLFKLAITEAEEAVAQVKDGQETVELSPQSAYIRRLQHLIAQRNALSSQSTGKDPNRRVRIYK
jgi:stage III sporulation protein SpoIIIAA